MRAGAAAVLDWLLGCAHARETWPQKRRNRRGAVMRNAPSYVACIDCGRERDYTLLDAPGNGNGTRMNPNAGKAADEHGWEVVG